MARPNSHSADQFARLSKLAHEQADRLSPEFSETRHMRIMRAVEGARIDASRRISLAPASSKRDWLWPMALAALVMLTAVAGLGLLWQSGAIGGQKVVAIDPAPTPIPKKENSSNPSHDQPVQANSTHDKGVVETAMAQQQWAGLNQDVRAATQYLVDQVPLRFAWQSDAQPDQQ